MSSEIVIIMGNLVRDPEMRYLPSGTEVATLIVATTQFSSSETCPAGWKPAYRGTGWEKTKFWRVTVFGKRAASCNEYLEKGTIVQCTGTLQGEVIDGTERPRIWMTNDGEPRANFEMVARDVQFGNAQRRRTEPSDDDQGLEEPPF